ncbi:MAG: metal-dependent hydrolase [Pseudomonadota bacterium]
MITAHLPAGYVLSRGFVWSGAALVAALLGSIWPDLDLIWFYLIDDRAFHHHRYWVHAPAFALAISAGIWLFCRATAPKWAPVIIAFGAGWCLHIALDGIAGGVMWHWPISDAFYVLVDVPARFDRWMLSFLVHWTMLLEASIWVVAAFLWWRKDG